MLEPVATASTLVSAPTETVWKHIVGKQSALFPDASITSGWRAGDSIEIEGEWNGKTFHDYGEVVSLSPGALLSFSHWSGVRQRPEAFHEVRVTLEQISTQTKVIIEQYDRGSSGPIDATTKAEFAKNWAMMLEGLKSACEAPRGR